MRRLPSSTQIAPHDVKFVTMDRRVAGREAVAGMGYRLAAGGLGGRLRDAAGHDEEHCIEDEWIQRIARGWIRAGATARLLPPAASAARATAAAQLERVPAATVFQVTAVCMLAAIASSTLLYWQKSRAAGIDREIGGVVHATEAANAQSARLRTEWLALNEPERLQDMASRHSTLRPILPSQFVDAAKLPDHLMAPGSPVPADDTDADMVMASNTASRPAIHEASAIEPVPAEAKTPAETPASETLAASAAASPAETIPAEAKASPEIAVADAPAVQAPAHATVVVLHAASGPLRAAPAIMRASATSHAAPAAIAHAIPAIMTHAVPAIMTHAVPAMITHAVPAIMTHAVPATAGHLVQAVMTHAVPKPHGPARVMMARFEMPHWLTLQSHPSRQDVVATSEQPHSLVAPPNHAAVIAAADQPRTGDESLSVPPEPPAPVQADPEPRPPALVTARHVDRFAMVYPRARYRPYYGSYYGAPPAGPYGDPYNPPPLRYYSAPYGGGYYGAPAYGGPYMPPPPPNGYSYQ